jgi:DNA (cytosine-5)-methyltransferase 1
MAESALRELLTGDVVLRFEEEPALYIRRPEFNFTDLFAGIGGTRLAFEQAGGKCVFTSEWDKYAVQTYRANHVDQHEIRGDITKVAPEEIPPHDVLVAGFPCQPFSLAGVSKKNSLGRAHGFLDETQGTLFFDIARIIKHHKPRAFLLENVKNLRSHDRGKTFKVIEHVLREELGYQVAFRVVDAKCLVPQHRERIYLVGFREDSGFDWDGVELPDPASGPRLSSILHNRNEEPEVPFTERSRKYTKVSSKYTLSDHLWEYLKAYAEKHRLKGNGFGCSVVGPEDVSRTLSARYHKDGSEILISQGSGKNPRRLTPRECARLMGFPETFRIPVSDTQAYRQFGNSVVVPVVSRIAVAMARCLRGEALPVIDKNQQELAFHKQASTDSKIYAAG